MGAVEVSKEFGAEFADFPIVACPPRVKVAENKSDNISECSIEPIFDTILSSVEFPLDKAPFRSNFFVGIIEMLELTFLPLVFVGLGVKEIDPALSALGLGAVEAFFLEFVGDVLPLFGFEFWLVMF